MRKKVEEARTRAEQSV